MNAITTMHGLIDAGFEQKQAEAVVNAVEQHKNENYATKIEVNESKTELKADLAEVKTELKSDIAGVQSGITEVRIDNAKINGKLDRLNWAVFSVGGGLLIGMATLIFTK